MAYSGYGAESYIFNAAGAVGGDQSRRSTVLESVGNILACPFQDDILDKTGNHTYDTGTDTIITSASSDNLYHGTGMLDVTGGAGNALICTATSAPHQIPLTEPVTIGCFLQWTTLVSTPQILVSTNAAGSSGNYGLQRQSSAGWRWQGSSLTTLGDHREITPIGRWFHVAIAVEGGRSTASAAEFYINGQAVWTGDVSASSAPASDDWFTPTLHYNDGASNWTGRLCNAFISDNLLDAATIKALSDEAFGHASPWAPPAP